MARLFLRHSIQQLEDMIAAGVTGSTVLSAIKEELSHRDSQRAEMLGNKVDELLYKKKEAKATGGPPLVIPVLTEQGKERKILGLPKIAKEGSPANANPATASSHTPLRELHPRHEHAFGNSLRNKDAKKLQELIAAQSARLGEEAVPKLSSNLEQGPNVTWKPRSGRLILPICNQTPEPRPAEIKPTGTQSENLSEDAMQFSVEDACNVLKVSVNSAWEEIEKARREFVQRAHPERLENLSPESREQIRAQAKNANAAYLRLNQIR